MNEPVSISKGGETLVEFLFQRRSDGLNMWIKADPRVEQFISDLSNGDKVSVTNYGTAWKPLKNEKLYVYEYNMSVDPSDASYTLNSICGSFGTNTRKADTINLSFLRFVGISGPTGLTFGIAGPISGGYIQDMTPKIAAALRKLLKEYLCPISIGVKVITTEL